MVREGQLHHGSSARFSVFLLQSGSYTSLTIVRIYRGVGRIVVSCVSVCLLVHAIKGKRLELSFAKFTSDHPGHALTVRSKVRRETMVVSIPGKIVSK